MPIVRFARAVKRAARATQGRLGSLTALVGEQLHALPIVQAFGMEPRVRTQFDAAQTRYLKEMDRSLLLRGSASPSIELLGITGWRSPSRWAPGRSAPSLRSPATSCPMSARSF